MGWKGWPSGKAVKTSQHQTSFSEILTPVCVFTTRGKEKVVRSDVTRQERESKEQRQEDRGGVKGGGVRKQGREERCGP